MYSFSGRLEVLKNLGVVGINVLVVSNDRPLPGEKLAGGTEMKVQNDQGFIGSLNPKLKSTFAIVIEVKRQADLHVVWAEGRDRNIRPLGDQTPATATALLSKRIPTDRTLSGDWVTKSTDNLGNSIWVISTAGGQLQMWEVAVVTIVAANKSNCYLSLQKVYAGEMFACTLEEGPNQWDDPVYVDDKRFPTYVDWTSLRLFLSREVSREGLRPLSECQQAEPTESLALPSDQAEVIWFNMAKGFGFAKANGEEKNPIFHRSSVQGQDFPAFEPGQIVSYAALDRTPRGAQLKGVVEL